jgi:hypothetical protein
MLLSTGQFFGASSGGGGSPAFSLDAYSPTGAWSMSRDLLSSFAGNPRYTTVTGVSSFKDQAGGGHNYDNSATGGQPAVSSAGPNSVACLDFDGSDDYLSCVHDASNYLAVGGKFIVVSCIIDAIDTDNSATGAPFNNDVIIGDNSGYLGMCLRSTGPNAWVYNFTGSYAAKEIAIATATPLVLTWRHDGTNLYISKNGGAEASVASGNTASLATRLQLGHSISGYMDGKIFEKATWNSGSTPDATARAAIIAGFMSHIGAT